METLISRTHTAIVNVITPIAELKYSIPGIHNVLVVDNDSKHYLVIRLGWAKDNNLYSVLVHIKNTEGKITIHVNNTERDIEEELVGQGIPTDIIEYKN